MDTLHQGSENRDRAVQVTKKGTKELYSDQREGYSNARAAEKLIVISTSERKVREYLAYWFLLGKKVLLHNGDEALLPKPVVIGDHYSQEFEDCWQKLLSPESGDCYLEGSELTIAQLLTEEWDIDPCARCEMPVPIHKYGLPPESCPCFDLRHWPNTEKPQPRGPISSKVHLHDMCNRLMQKSNLTNDDSQGLEKGIPPL
jgi:hypothetical protein